MADIDFTPEDEQEQPKIDFTPEPPPKEKAPLSNVAAMKSGVAEMSPEARSAAQQVVEAIPQAISGAQQAQMAVMTGGGSLLAEALTPQPVKEFMRTPLVSPENVDVGRRALQYPLRTILFGTPPEEQGALGTAGRFASEQIAAQTSPEALGIIAGTAGVGAAEGILAKRAPSLVETLFGRARPSVAPVTEAVVKPPPIPEELLQTERTANASEVTSPTSVSQPEVRTPVGERASLRQQRETAEARQGIEAQPQTQEVAPTVPQPEQPKPKTEEVVPPAAPTETPSQPELPRSPTSIKNEVVDQEREARGLPPASSSARQGFGELWDRVSRKIDDNPNYPDEIIESIKSKARALTDEEDAALLHRQIDLQNQYEKANDAVIRARESGDSEALVNASARSNALSDQLLEVYDVGKRGGTETGRGLNARKLLANEDFSLARMITQKRAAKMGEQLTEKETQQVRDQYQKIRDKQIAYDAYESSPRAEAYMRNLRKRAEDYRERIAKGDFAPTVRSRLPLPMEGEKLRADLQRARNEFQRALLKDRAKNRTASQKFWDRFVGVERAFKLSSDVVLAKLTAAAAVREAGLTPLEEIAGTGIGRVVPRLAARAPREGGFSLNAEIKAKTEMFTQGMKDAWQNLKMKQSDLDERFQTGKIKKPEEFYDYLGYLHGALKAPVKRAEFARSLTKRMEWAVRHGEDINNQGVMRQLSEQAYVDANRSIFLQDNIASKVFTAALNMAEKSRIAPNLGPGLARLGRFLVPIVKVPTNIVGEVATGVHGVGTGGIRAARAYWKGISELPPEQADSIMRQLKKGAIGNALILTGYFLRDKIGGFYHDQDKRAAGDVQPGRYRIGNVDLPASAGHSTGAMLLNIGATVGRVAEEKVRQTGSEVKGVGEGVRAAGAGLAHEIPFIQAGTGIVDAMDSKGGFTKYINGLITSTVVPQLSVHAAKIADTPGTFPQNILEESVKRKPTTPIEAVKMGIPGLRQTVPEKGKSKGSTKLQPQPIR